MPWKARIIWPVNWNGWTAERYTVGIRPGAATLYSYNNIHSNKASMTITNYGPIGDASGQDYVWNGTNELFDGSSNPVLFKTLVQKS